MRPGTGAAAEPVARVHPASCEHCTTPLHGDFCHRCGQSVHNPVRHARHAIEEFFEAFWHLDGRVWRTLRDLMVPGRVSSDYLDGHRACYIAPLRLFVVLSVLVFFIGAATVRVDTGDLRIEVDTGAVAAAGSAVEVQRERDRLWAAIDRVAARVDGSPGAAAEIEHARETVRVAAIGRNAELRKMAVAGTPVTGVAAAPPPEVRLVTDPAPIPNQKMYLFDDPRPWHPQDHPVVVGWLPDPANAWLNRRIGRILVNLERFGERPDPWVKFFMASVPTALFVLVPLFAVLLKLAYLDTRRLYLEHMVVALYSHAWLLIGLAVVFVLIGLGQLVRPHANDLANAVSMLANGVLLVAMPGYLLLAQKRVYRQRWLRTVLKYLAVGTVYLALLLATIAAVMVVRLAQA